MNGRGHSQEITLKDQKTNPCILCGQCALHCPVSAIQEQTSYADFERDLSDKEKIVIALIDPIIEASLNEAYSDGNVNLNSVATVLKKMGVDYVFSSATGVEIISYIQAEQILEGDGRELFLGSQCPAFVNYVKSYQQGLFKNLQKIKSPANLMGGIIKTYWAEKQKINPAKISVVSIGVCVARKTEIIERGVQIDDFWPVDIALTLRELIFLFKKDKQQLSKDKINNFDSFVNIPINLSSVSVFSSILSRLKTDNEINKFVSKSDYNFDDFILLQDGIGKKIGSLKGIGDFDKIFKDSDKYTYLEIMACPDACFGGGGQLIPTNENLRKKRKHFFSNKRILKNFDRDILDEQIVDILKWLSRHSLDKKILFRQ
jgi:iron only hydrogenase large subunit-like protein